MDYLFIKSKSEIEDTELDIETIHRLKPHKTVAVYSSAQFLNLIPKIKSQLETLNKEIISSKPDRTTKNYQILGCDSDFNNLNLDTNPDIFLYIGDGLFHPQTLALAQRNNKEFIDIIMFNPFTKISKTIRQEDISHILKKHRSSIIKFIGSDNIGIILTTKHGQEQFKASKELEKKYKDKSFYYFLDNNINFGDLENFPFIDCWVNTACPRLGFEDNANIPIKILNLNDALNAKEVLSKDSLLTCQ